MEDLKNLLTTLDKITPTPPKKSKNEFELIAEKFTERILFISIAMFVFLLFLAGVHTLSSLSEFWKHVAVIISCITMILPTIGIVIDIAVATILVFRFKEENFHRLVLEVEHDYENIDKISKFKKKTLKEAQIWLQLKCSKIKNRIGVFIGNPEKITLFSLASFGWLIWKVLSEKGMGEKLSLASGNYTYNILAFVTAFLVGMSIGAIAMNLQAKRYSYHLEIIEIALNRKP